MKAKLALIAIAIVVVMVSSCDEAAMVEVIIGDHSAEIEVAVKLVDLKVEPDGGAASTNPNPDREEILNFDWEGATEEERKEYWDLVVGMSVDVNVLDIADLNPEHLVIEVGVGESIEVINSDTTYHMFKCPPRTDGVPVQAGGRRGIVITELSGFDAGLIPYGRDDNDDPIGIFYVSDKKFISFTVVEFLLPDGSDGYPSEGVSVTTLDGEVTKKTDPDGKVFLARNLPLTVQLAKDGFVTTAVISEDGQTIVFLPNGQKNISFRVVEPFLPAVGVYHPNWPRGFTKNGPGIEGVTVTPLEGSDEGIKETDQDGQVSFFGTPPLKVRLEKPGYITIEPIVTKEEIVFPNEWPPELDAVIEQLGLTEVINSGELILAWGVEDTNTGFYDCSLVHGIKYSNPDDRGGMIASLAHEATHARQAIESNARCGLLGEDWPQSKEGQAWIVALEKDLKEHGPVPDHGWDDDFPWEKNPELPDPTEAMASFYADWAIGPYSNKRDFDAEEELKRLYRLAPNRAKYMEDRFGPPLPRPKLGLWER